MTLSTRKIFYLAAAAITDNQNRLLVVRKRNTEKFMLPGGKIEAGETPLDTLIREVKEEINLTLDPKLAIYIDTYHAPAANEPDYSIESNLFRVKLDQTLTLNPAAEIEEAKWVTETEVKQLNLAPMMTSYVIPLWLSEKE